MTVNQGCRLNGSDSQVCSAVKVRQENQVYRHC